MLVGMVRVDDGYRLNENIMECHGRRVGEKDL